MKTGRFFFKNIEKVPFFNTVLPVIRKIYWILGKFVLKQREKLITCRKNRTNNIQTQMPHTDSTFNVKLHIQKPKYAMKV